jgi:hypothetical protein
MAPPNSLAKLCQKIQFDELLYTDEPFTYIAPLLSYAELLSKVQLSEFE